MFGAIVCNCSAMLRESVARFKQAINRLDARKLLILKGKIFYQTKCAIIRELKKLSTDFLVTWHDHTPKMALISEDGTGTYIQRH